MMYFIFYLIFFFNDTATTEIYTLSLHDALPISVFSQYPQQSDYIARWSSQGSSGLHGNRPAGSLRTWLGRSLPGRDRKSTRLNSSHRTISYAVFCLKKKICQNQAVSMSTPYLLT